MTTFDPPDFLHLDELLSTEDRRIRDDVREWVNERFLPVVAGHYRDGTFPMELVPELAQLGTFGPAIEGHGCRGLGNVAAGLIMRELERGDSGLRTFASVQGSLAMTAIDLFGSEEQKKNWLPAMAQGRKLGCFALTEPSAGSNPASLRCRATRTADGYRLNGAKKWIGNGTVADVAIVWAKVEGSIHANVLSRGVSTASNHAREIRLVGHQDRPRSRRYDHHHLQRGQTRAH